jgi:hypothetical protein
MNMPLNFSTALPLESTVYLGPARVIETMSGRLRLALPECEAWAISAIGYPYDPQVGDKILAISQGEDYFVIGVLQGTGVTTFTAPGDIQILAPNGKIDLVSTKGISVRGPSVTIQAISLEFRAKKIIEKFVNAHRWIKETLQVHAGRVRTLVDSSYCVKAEKIVERAKKTVHIDGEKIHLG